MAASQREALGGEAVGNRHRVVKEDSLMHPVTPQTAGLLWDTAMGKLAKVPALTICTF